MWKSACIGRVFCELMARPTGCQSAWPLTPTGSLIPTELEGRLSGVGKIGTHEFKVSTVKTLEIGTRKWKDVCVLTANLNYWGIAKEQGPAGDVQGLLGDDMLASNGALIDFAAGKLWFAPQK